jgi:hypothetical protein
MTRNFTAKAVGEYINISGLISISACMLYKFEITNAGPGDITGVPDLTPFANITSLNINAIDISGQNTVGFLEYIVGTEILISEQNEISTFGHYNIDSYTQIGTTSFYTLNLTFIGGSGSIEEKKQYDTCSFVLSSTDNNTTYDLDSIQNGANSDIRLVGSDLTTDIVKLEAGTNVTLTDTGSNILIDVTAVGTVTSVDASIDGDSLSIAGVPITSAGTIAFNWEGTNLQYVDGEGNLQTFPTLPTGTVTSVGQTHAGNAFSVTGSPITTAGVLAIGLNGNATQYIDGAGDLQTFPAIPVVPSNIVETLDTTDSTYIDLTPTIPTTGDIVVTAELSAIDGNAAAGERYLTKTNKWAEISTIPGTYEWEIQGDTGGPTVVNSTDIVTFVGGTNVSTALVGTALTIDATDTNTTYDLTVPVATTNITLLGSDASSDSVTLTGGTNITVTRVSATELSIDGTDLNTTYNLEGVGSVDGTAGVRLAGSDASNDDVLIIGAGTTTVTRSLNTLTVTSNDQFDGTVTNVSASTTGDALDVAVTNPTTTPDLDFTWAGTASQYVDGQGDLQTFPAIPTVGDGTLTVQGTGVLGGTGTFTANQAGNTTISVTHDSQAQTNTTPSTTLTHGGTFTALSSNVGVNASGHVTGQELTTFTLPSDIQGVTSVNFTTDGNALNVVSNTITTSGTMIGIWQGASSQYVNGEGDLQDVASIPGTYEWDIAGDSGSGTVGSGDTINFAGGTNVTTAYSGTTLTINSTDQFQGTVTSVATTHAGNAFTASIGGVATVNPSVDITMNGSSVEYVDGAGNLQTFPAIPQGDITDVDGGTYITTLNSTGPIVTVNHNSTSRTDNTSTIAPAAGDTVTAVDSVTTNPTGHVTGLNLKSITLPTASESSETIDIQVKNISSADGGINLVKGDPVYIYGSVGASARLLVDLADADSTATNNLGDSKMPCVALLDQDLAPNIEGTATVVGKLRNLITSPINGVTPSENDTIYVKSGGGLTLTKPTGSTNLIQNVGQVGRVSTSADGNIVVAALLRTNDVPNLPTGRLFVGTAANTSLASDVVYVDDTNDRVGIGTTSPSQKLHVDGNARLTGLFYDGTNSGGTNGQILSSDGGQTEWIDGSAIPGVPAGSGTINYLARWTPDANTLGIGVTYDNGTNVGIGTTNPFEKLTIKGTDKYIAAEQTNYTWGSSFTIGAKIGTDTSAGLIDFRRWTGTGNNHNNGIITCGFNGKGMDFRVDTKTSNTAATTSRMHIALDGNVGIGTDDPDVKLEVSSSSGGVLRLTSTDTSVAIGESIGRVEFKSNDASTGGNNVMGFVDCLATNAGSTYALTFGTGNAAAATEKMRINQSGNVGIGTTNPGTYKLAVAGSTAIGENLEVSDGLGGDKTLSIDATIGAFLIGDIDGIGDGAHIEGDSSNIKIFNGGSLTLITDINQNVGIGTASLTSISSTSSTLSLGSTSATTSGGIAFQVSGGVVKAYNYVASNYLINQTVSGIGQIFYGAGSERIRIHNTTGNVGIGVTDPSEELEVNGTIYSTPISYAANQDAYALKVGAYNNASS